MKEVHFAVRNLGSGVELDYPERPSSSDEDAYGVEDTRTEKLLPGEYCDHHAAAEAAADHEEAELAAFLAQLLDEVDGADWARAALCADALANGVPPRAVLRRLREIGDAGTEVARVLAERTEGAKILSSAHQFSLAG